jgi:hypothetical protein
MHGLGTIIYPDGLRYEGEFIDDEPASTPSELSNAPSAESAGKWDRISVDSSQLDMSTSETYRPSNFDHSPPITGMTKHEKNRSFTDMVGRKVKNRTG